jgi:hypothetical protein
MKQTIRDRAILRGAVVAIIGLFVLTSGSAFAAWSANRHTQSDLDAIQARNDDQQSQIDELQSDRDRLIAGRQELVSGFDQLQAQLAGLGERPVVEEEPEELSPPPDDLDAGDGPVVVVGPEGPPGLRGPQGAPPTPTQILSAVSIFCIDGSCDGPQGPRGVTGATGASGPVGATGPQGVAGSDGAQGETGPAGPTGGTGPTGPQGPQGPPGPGITVGDTCYPGYVWKSRVVTTGGGNFFMIVCEAA